MSHERDKPARVWIIPALVFGLIGMSLSIGTTTFIIAANDPSFGVEERYYEKAVAWDEQRAQEEANERLAWTADVRITPTDAADGFSSLQVQLASADGTPLEAADVGAFVFHHARRSQPLELTLAPGAAPGVYQSDLRARDGIWQVRLRVERGPDVFTQVRDLTVADGGS